MVLATLFFLLVLTLATSAFEQAGMPRRSAMISPPAKIVSVDGEFFVDVVAYPFIEGRETLTSRLINNYQVQASYDQNIFTFLRAESLLPKFNLRTTESLGTIYLEGTAQNFLDDYFTFEITTLVRLYFQPKKEASSQVTVAAFTAENNFGPEGRTAILVDQYQPATITAQVGGACTPNCASKTCGTDGCGGFCGSLNGACAGAQETCQGGQCACVPECNLRECGDNGCGGTCGTCTAGLSCNGVQCVAPQQASTLIYTPPQSTLSAPRQVAAPSRPATSPRTPAQPSAPSGPDEGLHLYGPSRGIGTGGGVPSVPTPAPIAPPVPPVVSPPPELPPSEPQAAPAAPPVTPPPASPPVEKKFPWWIIIIIVAALILGGLGYYHYRQKKEQEAHAYYGQYVQPTVGTGVSPPQSPPQPSQSSQPSWSPSPPQSPQVPPRQPPF